MEIKTISYKRVHNLGNYNTEHLEMFVELTPDVEIKVSKDHEKKTI